MSKPIKTLEELDAALYWRSKHAQAIKERDALQQKLAVAAAMHPFAEKVIRKLERFQECADDGQGADIGRHWFDLLTQLGLLNRVQRSPALWEMSQQGEDALELSRQNAKSRQEYIRTPPAKPVTPPPSKSAAIAARNPACLKKVF
ncbi:hypothetical protein [Pseudomonas sp. B16120]|uniref:hypothetical protein n=1 Tax=Pseudomonas sp. B16120 TaxID=3235108 RepID=UPI0037836B44